jgi:hypothetical protein
VGFGLLATPISAEVGAALTLVLLNPEARSPGCGVGSRVRKLSLEEDMEV